MTHSLKPMVLCYHGVEDVPLNRDRSRLFVRPRDLERHIALLVRWGYELVTFKELAGRAPDGGATGLAAITFDDGLSDNLYVLLPILRAAGIPATVFVVSDWLGLPHPDAQWQRSLSADELRTLNGSGVEIGGHSTRHDHLPDLPLSDAEDDMRRCRESLERVIEAEVTSFAYPYGGATRTTRKACAAAGYHAACRSGGRGSWDDPFNLPRQDMQNRDSLAGLRLKRRSLYHPLVRTTPGLTLRRLSRAARLAVGFKRPGS